MFKKVCIFRTQLFREIVNILAVVDSPGAPWKDKLAKMEREEATLKNKMEPSLKNNMKPEEASLKNKMEPEEASLKNKNVPEVASDSNNDMRG